MIGQTMSMQDSYVHGTYQTWDEWYQQWEDDGSPEPFSEWFCAQIRDRSNQR
jgi:hypothetical protein